MDWVLIGGRPSGAKQRGARWRWSSFLVVLLCQGAEEDCPAKGDGAAWVQMRASSMVGIVTVKAIAMMLVSGAGRRERTQRTHLRVYCLAV